MSKLCVCWELWPIFSRTINTQPMLQSHLKETRHTHTEKIHTHARTQYVFYYAHFFDVIYFLVGFPFEVLFRMIFVDIFFGVSVFVFFSFWVGVFFPVFLFYALYLPLRLKSASFDFFLKTFSSLSNTVFNDRWNLRIKMPYKKNKCIQAVYQAFHLYIILYMNVSSLEMYTINRCIYAFKLSLLCLRLTSSRLYSGCTTAYVYVMFINMQKKRTTNKRRLRTAFLIDMECLWRSIYCADSIYYLLLPLLLLSVFLFHTLFTFCVFQLLILSNVLVVPVFSLSLSSFIAVALNCDFLLLLLYILNCNHINVCNSHYYVLICNLNVGLVGCF